MFGEQDTSFKESPIPSILQCQLCFILKYLDIEKLVTILHML